MSFEEKRYSLVKKLRDQGYIKTKKVIEAMRKVPRHLFLPQNKRDKAYLDRPLPIGKNQTISAPHMVGLLVEKLDPEPNDKVLEIGGGSGYNAAVIAETLDEGRVYSIEKIDSIAHQAKQNLQKTGYSGKVELIIADGSTGYEEKAPYDRILLTAGAPEVPKPLEEQLAENGKIVGPVGGKRRQKLVIGKKKKGKVKYKKEGRCAFVPLRGRYGY
ncbi:protein-L-isoaspartate O-methyltransferase [archaeon SCG-AAA382B04]|nr:protein-L-isoaspartate O-methyltransferase [archaeon SCG-AAA382B04]